MYQEWNPQLDQFFNCAALKRMHPQECEEGEEDEYAPEQCPCCGGYYCERPLLECTAGVHPNPEEISRYGKLSAKLRICCSCALLEEPVRLVVRTAFLLANGKQPYTAPKNV